MEKNDTMSEDDVLEDIINHDGKCFDNGIWSSVRCHSCPFARECIKGTLRGKKMSNADKVEKALNIVINDQLEKEFKK